MSMFYLGATMAYDDYDDDEPRTPEEVLSSVKDLLEDLDGKIKKMSEDSEDASAGLRLEIAQARREMVEVRTTLRSLQTRFDNQLTVMVLANIASGLGVAALVMGASSAL